MSPFIPINDIGKAIPASDILGLEVKCSAETRYNAVFPTSSLDGIDVMQNEFLTWQLYLVHMAQPNENDSSDTPNVSRTPINKPGSMHIRQLRTPLVASDPYTAMDDKPRKTLNKVVFNYIRALRKKEVIEQHKIAQQGSPVTTDLSTTPLSVYNDEFIFTAEEEEKMQQRYKRISDTVSDFTVRSSELMDLDDARNHLATLGGDAEAIAKFNSESVVELNNMVKFINFTL